MNNFALCFTTLHEHNYEVVVTGEGDAFICTHSLQSDKEIFAFSFESRSIRVGRSLNFTDSERYEFHSLIDALTMYLGISAGRHKYTDRDFIEVTKNNVDRLLNYDYNATPGIYGYINMHDGSVGLLVSNADNTDESYIINILVYNGKISHRYDNMNVTLSELIRQSCEECKLYRVENPAEFIKQAIVLLK